MALTKPKLSTNINTDSSVFSDPILVLHQGSTLANVDVGFLMNRSNGLTSNAAVIWQESSKSFVHILTNSSGVADSNLVVQSYANVSVGNVLLINNAGIYVDGTLGSAGQVLASDGFKTFWAPPGGFTGGTVAGPSVFQSNLVISNTTTSTSTTTGALVVKGGVGIAGDVNVGTSLTVDNSNYGNVTTTQFGSLFAYAYGPNNYSIIQAWSQGTQGMGMSAFGTQLYSSGAITFRTGATVRDKDFPTGGVQTVQIAANGAIINGTGITSTSTATGAVIVAGGVGVSGNVYSNAVYTATGVYWSGNGQAFTSTTIANTAEITANLSSGQNVGLNLTTTGVVAGNYGSATSIPTIVVDSKGRITSVTSNVVSTTITLAGGSGSGSVAGGGTLTVNGTTNQITTSVSASTITIALAQDVTAPGNLTVAGNLIVQGNTTTLNTETLTVEDLNITVANGAATAAAADGAGLTVAGANARLLYKSATDSWVFDKGVFASGNLVANSSTASTNTTTGALVVAGGAGISGRLNVAGNIVATGGSASSTTTTGAIVVTGGIGASGSINAGGSVNASAALSAGTTLTVATTSALAGIVTASSATTSTSITTGAVVLSGVGGGIGLQGNVFAGGNVYVRSRVGYTYSGNATSAVYQQYNAATNSLDTVFG